MEKIDPKKLGLPPRTVVFKVNDSQYQIEVNRKSRIIMKDAQKILEKAMLIMEKMPDASVKLKTSAPVCSKSIAFLKENQIDIV